VNHHPKSVGNITVVVTCYNHQSFVEQCLDSVLAQTQQPAAVIVIDDLSTDDSRAVIEHWMRTHSVRWTFVAHDVNRGVCASMNEALALVTTSHYLHISADDWLLPDRLALQSAAAEAADPSTAFIIGGFREVDAAGRTLAIHNARDRLLGLDGEPGREQLVLRLLEANIIPAPAVLVRTAAAREVGGYDEALTFEDYDLWLRLVARFPAAYHEGLVSVYRLLPSSMSRSPERLKAFRESEMAALRKQQGVSRERDAVIDRRIGVLNRALDDELRTARRTADEARRRARRRHARFHRP